MEVAYMLTPSPNNNQNKIIKRQQFQVEVLQSSYGTIRDSGLFLARGKSCLSSPRCCQPGQDTFAFIIQLGCLYSRQAASNHTPRQRPQFCYSDSVAKQVPSPSPTTSVLFTTTTHSDLESRHSHWQREGGPRFHFNFVS